MSHFIFAFIDCAFGVISKSLCQDQRQGDFPLFSSRSIVLDLIQMFISSYFFFFSFLVIPSHGSLWAKDQIQATSVTYAAAAATPNL